MKTVIIYLSLLLTTAAISSQATPLEILKSKDAELKAAISAYEKEADNKNRQHVIATINGIFDFSIMSQKVLPKNAWKQADSIQRTNFTKSFKRMIENSSMTKLDIYQSDSIHYDSSAIDGKNASVSSHLWYKGKQANLVYKMTLVGSQWRVYDLVINDLSTIRNYREQFSLMLQKKSLDELIELLKNKADSYETSE